MDDLAKVFNRVAEALQKITDNPDGGEVIVEGDNGIKLIFRMPPKDQRKSEGTGKVITQKKVKEEPK